LQNIDKNILSPVNPKFNRHILKMKMNDVVELQLNSPPISLFKSFKENEEMSIDILMLMMLKFQDFFNCKSKMNKEQVEETAYLIVQRFRGLTYVDIGMCLKLSKMNEKIYDRIDGNMIIGWLEKYDATKTNMIVLERQKQKTKQDSEWSALGERSSVQKLKDYLK
tara:strand:+ start:152 stop:649 length:498 start_codon:yes stop_codon:yes gene_type:complete